MPTSKQDQAFGEVMQPSIDTSALDNAIDWMKQNLYPEDVFSKKDLETWAEENGFVKSDPSA